MNELLTVAQKKLLLLLKLPVKQSSRSCLRDLLPHVRQVAHLVVQVLLVDFQTTQLRFQGLVVAIYVSPKRQND